jgi:adenylate cyclase
MSDAMGTFRDGLAKYRKSDFAGARALFGRVLAINPDDKAAQLYVGRCDQLTESPPPEDWGGVWVMEHK